MPAIQLAYCALVSALLSISYRLSRDSHFYHLAAAATPESRAAFEDHTEERVAGVAGDALLDDGIDDEPQQGHDRSMKSAGGVLAVLFFGTTASALGVFMAPESFAKGVLLLICWIGVIFLARNVETRLR